jgi:hypothetical protein
LALFPLLLFFSNALQFHCPLTLPSVIHFRCRRKETFLPIWRTKRFCSSKTAVWEVAFPFVTLYLSGISQVSLLITADCINQDQPIPTGILMCRIESNLVTIKPSRFETNEHFS